MAAATAGDSPADEADAQEPTVGLFGALAVGVIGVGLGLGANIYSRNQSAGAGSEASSPSTDSLFFTRHAEQWSSAGTARAKALFHDLQSTLERHISPGAHSLEPLPHSREASDGASEENGQAPSDAQQTQTAAAASDEPASATTTAGGNDLGSAPRRLTRQQTGALPVPSSAAKETPALEDRAAPATPTKKKVAKKRAVEQEQDAVGQNVPALALKARDNETPAEIAELLGVAVADVLWLNPWKRIGPNVALEPGTEVELPFVDESRQKSPRVKKRLIQRGPAGAKRRKGAGVDGEETEYVVEAVRGSRMKDDHKQYLVHWSGCECSSSLCVFVLATEPEPACADGSDEDTWEGADNLSCDRLVAEFESKGPSVPPPAKKAPTSQ